MSAYGTSGEFLYHYTTADTAFRHILPSRTLRLRPYEQMRDPLEAKEWHFELQGLPAELWEPEMLMAMTREALNGLRRLARLISFTVDAPAPKDARDAPFARGHARARMWEQYGDTHRGVCLCFRRQLASIIERQREPGSPFLARAVRYTPGGLSTSPARIVDASAVCVAWEEARAAIDAYDPRRDGDRRAHADRIADHASDRASASLVQHMIRHLDDLLFLKTSDWATEHEYRVVVAHRELDGDGSLFFPYEDALAAVILGERFPDWQLPAAAAACEAQHADLLRMKWVNGIPTPEPIG